MTYAITLEAPFPVPYRVQSDGVPAPSAPQSSPGDREYFRLRAAEEMEAAQIARCREARIAHEKLAAAYRQLCAPLGSQAGSGPASDVPSFELDADPLPDF